MGSGLRHILLIRLIVKRSEDYLYSRRAKPYRIWFNFLSVRGHTCVLQIPVHNCAVGQIQTNISEYKCGMLSLSLKI